MTPRHDMWDERVLDLAVEEVTSGLAPRELEMLLAEVDRSDLEALEEAAAALSLAGLGELEAPPAALTARLQTAARSIRPNAPETRAVNWIAWTGWAAAAVLLVMFLSRTLDRRDTSPTRQRDELIARATDLVRANWQATPDPLAGSVTGDIVWSSARQEGYMRFRGLPVNDATKNQYQLWIFDAKRAEWEAKPVDGGVFDIGPGGEVVVPIDAKLAVHDPKLFGVTLEVPGGVVVSQREHLLATATP